VALSDFISISISISAARATGPGFGTPLILSHNATWVERVRTYSSPAGVLADFSAHAPEYLAALAMFAQSPSPPTIKIGRSAVKPTQQFDLTPVVHDSTTYTVNILDTSGVSHAVTFTSGVGATASSIITGLKAAIDALSLALTTSNQGPNTFLRVLANNAGDFWGVWVDSKQTSGFLGIAQTQADPGVATDLAAIQLEDPGWYGLETLFNSKALIVAADGWAESNTKLYIAASVDTAIPNTVKSGATDVAATLQAAADTRVAVYYHAIPQEFADAAVLGVFLPMISGSEVWAFKTLVGITVDTLTETQRTNVLAKNANVIEQVAGVNIENQGKVALGEWIDVVRFRDWLASDMGIRIYNLLVAAQNKVSFDDDGIPKVAAQIRASLKAGQRAGGIVKGDEGPGVFSVTVPLLSAVNPTDRTNRNLTGVQFTAQLAGAIVATTITGLITE